MVERHAEELARAGCTLGLHLEPHLTGTWDPVRMEQVIVDLLGNAIKYGAGKPIEVTLTSDRELAKLEVRDHGIGIGKEDQARIFERFERAVSIRQYGGFGLGLYITRQICQSPRRANPCGKRVGAGSDLRGRSAVSAYVDVRE